MAPVARSKAAKPSKVVKPQKKKRYSTATTKHHRFQPFSERIARLKIDPIRRRRNADALAEVSEETATYLGRSLEEWRDLNLSATYTAFTKDVSPLCDSLPMVLHNQDRIIDIFITYIEKGDSLAMEPLLNLLSHFAHDLDVRFERHFERATVAVASVAAKHEDPAVIEWSFTCLAWLFKYLSRLLVPDLRPLFDLMAPYLGGQKQRPFIIRFAAESLGFLVRKAAAAYERDPEPLDRIVTHMLETCAESSNDRSSDLFQQGIMTLLTEAIKGVQTGIHSTGLATVRSLLKSCYGFSAARRNRATDILIGTLTSLVHHTTAESFEPILQTVLDFIQDNAVANDEMLLLSARVIFTMMSVRKGTRVADCGPVVKTLKLLLEFIEQLPSPEEVAPTYLSALAVMMQLATVDAVLPALSLVASVRKGMWRPHFLPFCDLLSRLGHERFQQFVFPELQRFLAEDWQQYGDSCCLLLPRLTARGNGSKLQCPPGMQASLVAHFEALPNGLSADDLDDALAKANTVLVALPHLKLGEGAMSKLHAALLRIVQSALSEKSSSSTNLPDFALGSCLSLILDTDDGVKSVKDLWRALCQASSREGHLAGYWSNILRYIQVGKPASVEGTHTEDFDTSLITALAFPSHTIRQSCLEIMQELYQLRGAPVPDVLSTAIAIESTPPSLESSRAISMNIRRLASGYVAAASDVRIRKAVATYCFGLLHLQLAQAWEDAVNTIAEICKSADGEEVIISLGQSWLEGVPEVEVGSNTDPILDINTEGFRVVSDFECSNLAKLSAISEQVFNDSTNGFPSVTEQFRVSHKHTPAITATARGQALRVLSKVPQIAEKRSRVLVPVLLSWAGAVGAAEDDDESTTVHRWNRKDQKAMLSVFAQFTNPRVLYRSSDVYDALLNLCANGDVEIQRSALRAVLSWKVPAVNRYEEHLLNLLDEARFREEISVFLQDDSEEDNVRLVDHARLMPVLLRLLYGRAVAGGKHGPGSRRKAIFVALSRFGQHTIGMFVDVASSTIWDTNTECSMDGIRTASPKASLRQQLGMLNMLGDLLETLGPDVERFASKIMHAVLLCTVPASRQINAAEDDHLEDAALLRSIRQTGFQCLVQMFLHLPEVNFSEEAEYVMDEVILARLSKFASENAQSISGMLRLFAAWSTSPRTAAYLTTHDGSLLEAIAELLREPIAKDDVRLFVLREILDKLLDLGGGNDILQAHITSFTHSIGFVLRQQISKEVLDACVTSIAQLAERITDAVEARDVVAVCTELLIKPSKLVSPRTKTGLLRTLQPLLQRTSTATDGPLYDAVSALFSRLTEPEARALLSDVLVKLCQSDEELLKSANICSDLNASGHRLDEPDHERRERGFRKISELWEELSPQQWLPVVQNCLFYVRDADDLVNRSSAAQGLQRFIDAASKDQESYTQLIAQTLLPGIERGMSESSELVRAEFLRILGHLVELLPDWQVVSDMTALLVGGDEEASVFANILHIQQHRRLRALRRLADEASKIKSSNVAKILLPLLEHFVFDQAEGDAGRTLADQTVITIGALAKSLNWSAFRATFKRYTGYISSREELEKTVLRLLGALVDSLAQRADQQPEGTETGLAQSKAEVLTRDFLPPLLKYLHQKDESTVDRRMPVAVTIVKILLALPEEELSARLPPVLTDVSHILRSRSQEARDQTRKTLASILSLVGPRYLGFMLKELRSSLQRGYQLHVLSFTVHSLLVNVTEVSQVGELDECLPELTSIIMDDIFGITGQEKDAEEYKSGMKEIKSSKSFDTMELLARVTPANKLGLLIRPLRALLTERLDAKAVRKAAELLTRLRKGIDQNPAADSRDMLVFCHEIVRQVYAENTALVPGMDARDYKTRKYLIQMESANKSKARGATTSQMYKLTSFAINLVRKVVRRHEDLQTPANMAGFLPMIGDGLVEGHEEVKLAAIRLLATIVKVPLKELETNAPVYVKEAVALIKSAPSITADSAKAALELITAVLREKRSVTVKEADIAHVLKAIKADIDEPDRSGMIYKFLRAVLGRKIVITEVYETMDEVGKVMVTNADRNVRESARSAYLQFVREYPQGKDRWIKQAGFLVENLRYEHASGRQSVMELLHQLLSKVSDEVMVQLGLPFFVALVPVKVGDAEPACRQMAGILLAKLFERAAAEALTGYLTLMDKWLDNDKKPMIQVAALECWATYLRQKDVSKQRVDGLRDKFAEMVTSEDVVVGEQVLLALLDTFTVLVEAAPDTAFAAASADMWECAQQCLVAANIGVQEKASQLIGAYFSHLASSSSKNDEGLAGLPLRGSGGLELDADDMRQYCRTSLRTLMTTSSETTEALMAQTVRNLVFLGRCLAANGMPWREESQNSPSEDDEEGEGEKEDLSQPAISGGQNVSALNHLHSRLSYLLRADKFSTAVRTAALQAQSYLLTQTNIIPPLTHLLRPLYSLTDPSIPQPQTSSHAELVDKARELMEMVRKKVGSEKYVAALGEVRKEAQGRREERRQKRKIEAVSAPERWAREKKRRHEVERTRKKVKGAEARGKRRGW